MKYLISTTRALLLVTLVLWFGLQIFRVFLPTSIWYLGQYLPAESLALVVLGIFALPALMPLVRMVFGFRGSLALAAGGIAVVRAALQFAGTAWLQLALAAVGIVLWGGFLPLWLHARRNRPTPEAVPLLAPALGLAFLLDTASRTMLWSYDLIYRHTLWAELLVGGLAVLLLALVWFEIEATPARQTPDEPPLSRTLAVVGLGPFFYLTLATLHNPAALAAATGWGDLAAGLLSNGLVIAGSLVGILTATGWPGRRPAVLALLNALVLSGMLALLALGIGPGWLWATVAALNLWAALGWLLWGTARAEPLQSGMWRTSLAVILALVSLLVLVFAVMQLKQVWAPVFGGALTGLASAWVARYRTGMARERLAPSATPWAIGAAVALVGVLVWSAAERNEPQSAPANPRAPLRVMTYNIHQGIDEKMRLNLEAIAETIRQAHPDVVALNEVNRGRSSNGFVDVLPYLSHKLGMPYVFGANSRDGQYGNALLSRYPVQAWSNHHYRINTTERRGVLEVSVQVGPGEPVHFFVTHLDQIGGPQNARQEQASEALDLWRGQTRSVLLGDLNAEPYKPELANIYQAGWVDTLQATGKGQVFTFWDPNPQAGRRIDYIFVTPDISIESTQVLESRASDHLPVVAVLDP